MDDNHKPRRYYNPASFIMRYSVPFNFDWGWEDHDAFYHDATNTFDILRPSEDPCLLSDDMKAAFNAQRDVWVKMYEDWCDKIAAERGE